MPKKHRSKLLAAVHETAGDLYKSGGLDARTMRNFDALCLTPIRPMTPKKIRALRTRENASQTVFAAYLNVTPGKNRNWYLVQTRPQGASLKLLSLVEQKGLQQVS
jgi:putative transcriptional regulator